MNEILALLGSGQMTLGNCLVLAGVACAVGFLPLSRTLFSLSTGAMFGFPVLLITLPFGLIGSILAFLFSRYFLQGFAIKRVERYPHLHVVMHSIELEGWRFVMLVSMGPPIPNFIQNYFFGLTRITFTDYVIGSALAVSTLSAIYTYFGSAGIDIVSSQSSALTRALAAFSIIAGAACIWLITIRARKVLQLAASLTETSSGKVNHRDERNTRC